ncbi:MAG: CPBP family glutamic-type intramembrane protease [Anaerolineae bacterium]
MSSVFIAMLLSNVWEEIGWRGFALPRFQERFSDLATALLMGVLWMLWHLPLMLTPASPMSTLPWHWDLLFSLALSVLYIWLYNCTRRSLLLVTLFHAMSNTVAWVLLEVGVYTSSYPFVAGVTAAVAAAIVLRHGTKRFGGPALGGEHGG